MTPSDKNIDFLVRNGYTVQFKYGDMLDLNCKPFTGYRVKVSKESNGWHGFGKTWKKALQEVANKFKGRNEIRQTN